MLMNKPLPLILPKVSGSYFVKKDAKGNHVFQTVEGKDLLKITKEGVIVPCVFGQVFDQSSYLLEDIQNIFDQQGQLVITQEADSDAENVKIYTVYESYNGSAVYVGSVFIYMPQ